MNKTICNLSVKQFICLLLALVLAFGLAIYYVHAHLYNMEFGHDEGYYLQMAQRIADRHIYAYNSETPNAFVPPGLPLYLTLCYKTIGFDQSGLAFMRVLQAVYLAITVFLVFLFGYKLTGSKNVGITAAWIVTLNLGFYSYTFSFLTENIYFMFLMLFSVVFLYSLEKNRPGMYIISGILFAAAVMIRSAVAAILPILIFPVISRNMSRRPAFKNAGMLILGFIIPLIPWIIRNLVVLGQFIPFCMQNNVIYEGLAKDLSELSVTKQKGFLDNLKLILELLKTDPAGTIIWFTLGKFQVLFMEAEENINSLLTSFNSCFTVFTGLPVIMKSLFSKKYRWAGMAFLVYLFVIFLGVPTQRYSLQFILFLSVASAYLLNILFGKKSSNEVMTS